MQIDANRYSQLQLVLSLNLYVIMLLKLCSNVALLFCTTEQKNSKKLYRINIKDSRNLQQNMIFVIEQLFENIFTYIYLNFRRETPRDRLLQWIEQDNERREENALAIIDPDAEAPFTGALTAAEAVMALNHVHAYTRVSSQQLVIATMTHRLNRIWNGNAPRGFFKPQLFGPNMFGYWVPLILEIIRGFLIIVFTVVGVHVLYSWVENFHYNHQCSHWVNMYSFQCYVAKKVRYQLEEMNYNTVYTVFCGVSVAGASVIMRLKNYIRDVVNVE